MLASDHKSVGPMVSFGEQGNFKKCVQYCDILHKGQICIDSGLVEFHLYHDEVAGVAHLQLGPQELGSSPAGSGGKLCQMFHCIAKI